MLSYLHVSKGELRTPSVSIPKGTIIASFYTFTVYALVLILVSSICDRSESTVFDCFFCKDVFIDSVELHPSIFFVSEHC